MLDRVPSWLQARPSVHSAWLQWRNLGRRWPVSTAALLCAFLALAALGRIPMVAYALALAALSPRLVLVVTTVAAATLALRHRRRLQNNWHRHWLAPLPSDVSFTARTAAVPVAVWVAVALLAASLSLVAGLPAWMPARLLGWCAGGVASGVGLAAVMTALSTSRGLGGARTEQGLPRSRYVPLRRGRSQCAIRVSLLPLGEWPRAATRFRDRPSIRGRSLLLLLLLVPMRVSGGAALAAAAAWLLILHMINLLLALTRAAFGAAWWLAPTPLGAARFAAALAYRNFAAQIVAAAALFAIAYVVVGESSLRAVCTITTIWLGVIAVLGTTVCVAALRSRSIAASRLHRWRQ